MWAVQSVVQYHPLCGCGFTDQPLHFYVWPYQQTGVMTFSSEAIVDFSFNLTYNTEDITDYLQYPLFKPDNSWA